MIFTMISAFDLVLCEILIMFDKVCCQLCNFRPGEIKCFIADTIFLASDGKLHTLGIMVNREDVAVRRMTACAVLVFQKVSKFLSAWVIFLKKRFNAKFPILEPASTHDLLVQFLKTIHISNRFTILNRRNSLCRCRRIERFCFSEQCQLFVFLFCISKRLAFLVICNKPQSGIGDDIFLKKWGIIRNFCFL